MNKIVAYIRLLSAVPAVEAVASDIAHFAEEAKKGEVDVGAIARLVNVTKSLLGGLVTGADAVLHHRCNRSLRFALLALRAEVMAVLEILHFWMQLRKRVF